MKELKKIVVILLKFSSGHTRQRLTLVGKFLVPVASTVTLGSTSRGAHDHILLTTLGTRICSK
jgi:hypothetical protein